MPIGGPTTPFVGRRAQLSQLESFLEEASAGRPLAILLSGEVGIGKTRLVRELRSLAQRKGARVLYGRCHEDVGLPYMPFVEAVRPQLDEASEEIDRLIGLDTEVVRHLLLRRPASTDQKPFTSSRGEPEQLELFLAVSNLFIGLAQKQFTVLLLDDLHWADRASLSLLSHVVFAVADTSVRQALPLLIVGTYRPVDAGHPMSRVVARLEREEISKSLELSGLSDLEVDELVQALGFARPSHQLVSTIGDVTGGNPLFVQEVIHHLAKRDALEERAGYLIATVSPAELRLPGQLRDAIVDRIEELSEDCRRVLNLGSLLGDSFDLAELQVVSDASEEELLDRLEEAMGQALLLSEGERFQFAHPLVRHALYDEASAARRQRMHWQIADALERRYSDSLDDHVMEIAQHLVRAGPSAPAEKVVQYAHRAGDQAMLLFAWGEAASYFEAAVSAAETSDRISAQKRAELHYLAGVAHYRNQDSGPCLSQFESAVQAFRRTRDVRGLAMALKDKTRAQFTIASVPIGGLVDVEPLEGALEALGDQDAELRGRVLQTISEVYFHARQPERAEEVARQALHIAEQINNERLSAEAAGALALAHMQSLRLVEALADLEVSQACAERADDPWLHCWPLTRQCSVLVSLGRLQEAERLTAKALEESRDVHNWAEYSLALAYRVATAYHRGDFAAVERHSTEGMAAAHRSHYPWGPVVFLPTLAHSRCLRGAFDEAEDAIASLTKPGGVLDDPGPAVASMTVIYRALINAMAGRAAEATKLIQPILPAAVKFARRDIHTVPSYCALAEIGSLLTEPPVPQSLYEPLVFAHQQGAVLCPSWGFLIPRVLALVAADNRSWDKAEVHYREAIQVATRIGSKSELGRSCLGYSRMLVARDARGDRDRAIGLVGEAGAIFDDLEAELFVGQATRLAEELQAKVPVTQSRRAAYPDNLSERELEVLRLLARGRTNQQIADDLVLSAKTAARHVSNIYTKIRVDNRAAATAYAFEKGLVPQAHRPGSPQPSDEVSGTGSVSNEVQ